MGERFPYRLSIVACLILIVPGCMLFQSEAEISLLKAEGELSLVNAELTLLRSEASTTQDLDSGQQQSATSQDSNIGMNTSNREINAAGGDNVREIEPMAAIWLGSLAILLFSVPLTLAIYLMGHRSKSVRAFFDLAKGKDVIFRSTDDETDADRKN